MENTSTPTVPLNPQSSEVLKERLSLALIDIYDVEEIAKKVANGDSNASPTSQSKHIFDTEDGFRFGISVDNLGTKIILHVSLSFAYKVEEKDLKKEVSSALAVLHRLTGIKRKPDWGGISPVAGVLHFTWNLSEEERNNGNLPV